MRGLIFTDWMSRLHKLLEETGPLPKRDAIQVSGLVSEQIDTVMIVFPEDFQELTFLRSGRTRSSMFYDLLKASPVLALGGDHRIVDFAASRISLKVRTRYDARSVIELLKWQIGYHQAREVVKRLGYRYRTGPRYSRASERFVCCKTPESCTEHKG